MTTPAISISLSGTVNGTSGSIAVGDLLVRNAQGLYVVATAAARGTKVAEAIATTPYGSEGIGGVIVQETGTVSASVSGLAAGTLSFVRCSATGRIERCAASDVNIVGRCEEDGSVHLFFSLPPIATVPSGTADALVGLDGAGGLKNLTATAIAAGSVPYWDGSKIAWLSPVGRVAGDILTLTAGLLPSWATPAATFNPKVLPGGSATLKVWYDMGNATSGGGLLTALPDKSGNGYAATIPAGAEPSYTAVDAAYNNIATVTFPATNTKRIVVPNLGITTGPYTMVIVCDANSTSAYSVSNSGANGLSQIFYITTTSTIFASKYLPGALSIQDGVRAPTLKNVVVVVGNGSSSKIYVSKKTLVGGNTGDAGTHDLTGTTMMLGNYGPGFATAYSQNGKTAHFLVYQGAASQSDVEYLLNGFGTLAGISIAA